ncbi:dimethyl sulfoxide reductase anchor subunit [Sulfitobacter sp. M57]|uniref:dimethyl sulfoxide reductase anchor subunit family protein n=1 Tax=unclassified Sulfitobacter TaxID=196795 RepID=UPI0023E31F7D|nr:MULTISPECIES: DmsC/YnfH family molybdoenzyme membrane anchor subunit [unclassified Sulfitobacter]MDF3414677.1 dimethyl sulfoxide reductase anchor subunit [Sulfitobacter sp. KE5]MDF3422158.1 dimethyl sulfoxide reductase anchor subunit [Sulfitobacter sp. KE43]MDF3433223.1 dimethyl sulfoxide reductase anchor subunit [Sulfitobacter sp. KE42]MDF3458863.1 dimethyl sulfoxide reductase anchor subunit [Sulfitobacter sp. S74]MDF3462762.1 dimethyl sulfoxide reductase anchor subunit [Sulfitobacter sp. 
MHPAPSVIFFSVFSGLGFGLLAWLGLGIPAVTGFSAFAFFTIAYLLAVGGLISSTFHLGHPERALKAFTQWRSSWLSREAWCAVAALVLMGIYGLGLVFFDSRWTLVGLLGALFSLGTVFTTSMIYAQLKTVPRWHMPLTPLNFLSLSLAGGALLAGQVQSAVVLILIAACLQIATWLIGDKRLAQSGTTMASATQLGDVGTVRAFEPPHTGTNYLLREFVHVIGRKHASKLRIIALILMGILPIVLLLLPFNHIIAVIAVLAHVAGVLTARWLFFAQAEHVVGLYYGKR